MHEDWSTLKKLIWLRRAVGGAAAVLKTVTGALLHITDALAKPAHELVAVLKPVQDLHGYDAPWPAGGGKNKVGCADGTYAVGSTRSITVADGIWSYKVNSAAQSAIFLPEATISAMGIPSLLPGTYTFSLASNALSSSLIAGMVLNLSDGQAINNGNSFTISAETSVVSITNPISEAYAVGTYTCDIQIEAGSSATAWTPYSNECPISGWTGAIITGTGKNLFDISNALLLKNPAQPNRLSYFQDGIFYSAGKTGYYDGSCLTFSGEAGATYTLSFDYSGINNSIYLFKANKNGDFYDKKGAITFANPSSSGTGTAVLSFTFPSDTEYAMLTITGANEYSATATNIQLELNSTATAYEAYTGTTLPINWQTEAGTIYGGTVTLNEDGSVDVVSDSWFQEFTGEEAWYDNTVSGNKKYFLAGTIPRQPVGGIVMDVKSSIAKYDESLGAGFNIPGYCMAYGFTAAKGWIGYCFDPDDMPTVEDFKSFLAELYANGTPAQFYAKLRTEEHYHLDNIGQLVLFLGENNIWVDASDDLTLTYYADGNASDAEALNTLLGGMYSPGGDVSDREALNILLGN